MSRTAPPGCAWRQLRAAAAYAATGRMLDAALAYAAPGMPVFPLTDTRRRSLRATGTANGKPIPGTGRFKKATTDPIQIQPWWETNEYLIGLPTGWSAAACGASTSIRAGGSRRRCRRVEKDRRAARADRHPRASQRNRWPAPDLRWDPNRPSAAARRLPDGIESRARAATSWCRRHAAEGAPTACIATSIRSRRMADRSGPREPKSGATTAPGLYARHRSGRREAEAPMRCGLFPTRNWLGRHGSDAAAQAEFPDRLSGRRRVRGGRGHDGKARMRTRGTTPLDRVLKPRADRPRLARRQRNPCRAVGGPMRSSSTSKPARTRRLVECRPVTRPPQAMRTRHDTRSAPGRRIRARAEAYELLYMRNSRRPSRPISSPMPSRCSQRRRSRRCALTPASARPSRRSRRCGRRGGRSGPAACVYTVDRHRLGDKIEERLAAVGVHAKVFRGRGADDPDNPGQAMCLAARAGRAGDEGPRRHQRDLLQEQARSGLPAVRPVRLPAAEAGRNSRRSGSRRTTCCSSRRRRSASRPR